MSLREVLFLSGGNAIDDLATGLETPAQPHPDCAAQGNDLTARCIGSLIFYIRPWWQWVRTYENICTWCSTRYVVTAPKTLAAILNKDLSKSTLKE